MDPFNMPSFGSTPNFQGDLQQSVNTLAPLATTYHGPLQGASIPQYNAPTPSQGGLSKFAHFLGGVGSEIGHIANSVTRWLGNNLIQGAEAPYKFGSGIAHGWLDRTDLSQINSQRDQLSSNLTTLNSQFKSGKISAKDYKLALNDITNGFDNLSRQSTALNNRLKADQNQTIQAGIDTSADVVTILTGGFGKFDSVNLTAKGAIPAATKTAADYLGSVNANAFLSNVEKGITKLASDPEAFARLSPAAQKAIQGSTAEVISQASSRLSAGQIARASAANLALKYPIFYNYLSGTGTQLYNQLDNKKYGGAVRTLAFNAALLLSGGPIGYALQKSGKAVSYGTAKVFARSSFLDELSKGIGNGTPSGLYEAINKLPEAERADVVKQMSAVEATNMGAAGNDSVAAAWRVLNGMQSYEGVSLDSFSHEEALNNMVNFARAQRLADETAKSLDIGPVTVGRIDARQLNEISAALSGIEGTEARQSAWEAIKARNPSAAWANNENLDKQLQTLIDQHPGDSLDTAIRGIRASFQVDGFPKSVSTQLSKMGYIPIKPLNLKAPFEEGSGTLVSRFGRNNDFFTHSVQPLPVLGHLGDMIAKAGLSPQASSQRVYEVFNQNLAETLTKTEAFAKFRVTGETDAQGTDYVIKRLSDYSHELSGRRLPLKAPITDLRQLTISDISTALDVSRSEAREVRTAVSDAMIKVPLQIRGLGDKIMDFNYKLNPLSKPYARLQGALRFSWNPFFQVKLATKTEFLSQLEAGGKTPPIGGIAALFSREYGQLNDIRTSLRNAGLFEERAGLGALGGAEAVQDGSAVGANLTHKLLPIQEKSIAGLIATQAEKANMDVESFIKAFPGQTRDTIQMIASYDRRSQLLNSPLVRTLNFAFFPFRFELKVATITARALAKTAPIYQMAFIKGLYNGSNWLKSSEGQAWYARNSEVIGLMKYFSPLATFSQVAEVLGHPKELTSYGELGGLPFGWIPQLLDAEGLTHGLTQAPFVNPKTGQTAKDYIPVTARGQLQTAIADLLGSLYSYPGATVGLPSKGTVDRFAATAVTGGKSKADFRTITPQITAEQKSFQDVVQGLAGTKPNQPLPADPQLQPAIKVPAEPSPVLRPLAKPASSRTARKRKSQYTPALLPGQSSLGQLP